MILVAGRSGDALRDRRANSIVQRWRAAAGRGGFQATVIETDETTKSDRAKMRRELDLQEKRSDEELWIVLAGKGSEAGGGALELPGSPLLANDLSDWLNEFDRPIVVIHLGSHAGRFLTPLARPGRVILTATKPSETADEPRFAEGLTRAIEDSAADQDGDGQTSLLEAWIAASKWTDARYFSDGVAPEEHSLLCDTSEGRSLRPSDFAGVQRIEAKGSQPDDGLRAHQRHLVRAADDRALPAAARRERDEVERQLVILRSRKPAHPEAGYDDKLEEILLRIAELSSAGENATKR